MRRWVWFSATLAPVALIGGWTVAQSRQPARYDPLHATISALAAHGATDAWIMTTGLAVLGACHLLTAAGAGPWGRAARVTLAVGGAATVAVAAAPQPSPAHVPAATVAFVALSLWPALIPRFRPGRWIAAALLLVLGWFALAMTVDSLVGLSERVLAGAQACAPLAVLVVARAVRRRTPVSQPIL